MGSRPVKGKVKIVKIEYKRLVKVEFVTNALNDARAISEYYAELFTYTPSIMNQAFLQGDPYERFKIVV